MGAWCISGTERNQCGQCPQKEGEWWCSETGESKGSRLHRLSSCVKVFAFVPRAMWDLWRVFNKRLHHQICVLKRLSSLHCVEYTRGNKRECGCIDLVAVGIQAKYVALDLGWWQ